MKIYIAFENSIYMEDEPEIIGLYSTRQKAENGIEKYKQKQLKEYGVLFDSIYSIEEYELDPDDCQRQ